ncbi:sugar transferase [Methylobacterium sp. A54F]
MERARLGESEHTPVPEEAPAEPLQAALPGAASPGALIPGPRIQDLGFGDLGIRELSMAELARSGRPAAVGWRGRRARSVEAFDARPLGGHRKRAMDLVIALLVAFLVLPLIVVLMALLRATSAGPVFFAQTRIGFDGRTFRCLKFRTMVVDGDAVLQRHLRANPAAAREWEETRKLRNDPRITPVGRFLRLTSLDELPQLINIIRGEMSLVGPRPIVADELDRYGLFRNCYLRGRPGLTGLWQVSGRSCVGYGMRVELDRTYVAQWSPWVDLKILCMTVPAVLRTHEAG